MLEENGIQPTGDLTTFPALGDAVAVANLIVSRREKDSQQSGSRQLEDVRVSPDGKELTFRLRTEIEVQKPELLLQEFGVSQLFRITVAKASLSSVDGNLMGKWWVPTAMIAYILKCLMVMSSSSVCSNLCKCVGTRLQQWSRRTSPRGFYQELQGERPNIRYFIVNILS